ncbi:DUF4177 domain-containing protein [Bacillus infantis]|uniref:DUF4177 domain-containing protein n=1 Tax=Bacillus infantis TaxID=324767 RepID=UPI002FBE3B7E
MKKYEYKTISLTKKGFFKNKNNPDEELNELGREGWKVVSSYAPVSGGTSTEIIYTLMREYE